MVSKYDAAEKDRLFLEATQAFEEGATYAFVRGGQVVVCVAEEKAVDSYNHSFECQHTMSPEQAVELRDWLISRFPL